MPKSGLAPLVEALEARGVAVEAICPASLLALQHRLAAPGTKVVGGESDDAAVWPAGDQVELVWLDAGKPRGWYLLPGGPKDLLQHLGLEALNAGRPLGVLAWGLSPEISDVLARLPDVRVTPSDAAPSDSDAVTTAASVLAGTSEPWVNLRRDDLAVRDRLRLVRRPLTFAAAGVVLCVLSACAALLWRADRYDRLASRYADEQQEVFRQIFPRQPLPPDVRSRLASEERNLRGLSGDPSAAPPEARGWWRCATC